MIPQFQHEANTSFALWLDYYMSTKAQAFSNKEVGMYYTPDERLLKYPEDPLGFITYSSEYKQWVYDHDIQNAQVPNGVHIDTGNGYEFCARGQSGLMIDFDNGRILLDGDKFPDNYQTLQVKTDVSVKDVNIYLADDTEENLVVQGKYNINSRTTPNYGQGVGIEPYEHVAPAAFISMESSRNTPYAFGGEDLTRLNYRVVLFAEDLYQLDGFMSVCTDAKELAIRNLGYDNHPFDNYGDLKEGSYSYSEAVTNCQHPGPLMFIEDVQASKISDKSNRTNNPDLYLGFVDFQVSQARFPRS